MHFEQIFKKHSIVNKGCSQLFRACRTIAITERDVVSDTIVRNDSRVIHRDVSRLLLEVAHRVASRFHNLGHQPVGIRHGGLGIIHKSGLLQLPRPRESIAIFGRQRDQVQFLHTLLAFVKSFFSAPAVAFGCCKPVVLGSKSGLQPLGLLLSQKHPKRRDDCRDRNQRGSDQ